MRKAGFGFRAAVLAVLLAVSLVTAGCQALPVEAAGGQTRTSALQLYEGTVTLPTYPYEDYQSDGYDPQYRWHYQRFDYERFRTENPAPQPRTYQTVVLENEYLRLIVLPELGGRLWRVIHKPTGDDLFYHNPVVMPSPWGPADMGGWLALGGIEWGLPVAEHGYAWGTPWEVVSLHNDGQQAAVTLALPDDGQVLGATIKIGLAASEAAFTLTPTVTNVSDEAVRFAFWHSAALAPGKQNTPSAETRFIIPADNVAVHSTADSALPGMGHTLTWPLDAGRDLSRLGNWHDYLGFFEWPAAHGPFVAVYDPVQDAGGVRVFPAEIARGSKVFALGWQRPLDTAYYTNDGSSYVELHGGLAPTFNDQVALHTGEMVTWRETWYPLGGIGGVKSANEHGALTFERQGDGVQVGFYPTQPFDGELVVLADDQEVGRMAVAAAPDAPFTGVVLFADPTVVSAGADLTVRVLDRTGIPLLAAD
jgi:hypothetical protein